MGVSAPTEPTRKRRSNRWNVIFVAGMWFQDLFNYDFRRTEMCIIPYATQQGEISFCAYNTGIGWRKIIENMHKTAAEEERARRKAEWEAQQARQIFEELVLKKPKPDLVQISGPNGVDKQPE